MESTLLLTSIQRKKKHLAKTKGLGSLQKGTEQNLLWKRASCWVTADPEGHRMAELTCVSVIHQQYFTVILPTQAIKEVYGIKGCWYSRNRPQSLILVWDPTACRQLRLSLKLLILHQILQLLTAAIPGILSLSWGWTSTSRPTKFPAFT